MATYGNIAPILRADTLKTIVMGGLVAGTLDGIDAVVSVRVRGISIVRLFQFIASGLMGEKAFRGGLRTVALGCALHFLIATGAAAVYYALSFKTPALLRRPVLCGPVYGLAVYCFMHYLVVPLSSAPVQPAPTPYWILNQVFSHTIFVGLPIALIASWSACRRRTVLEKAVAEIGSD